MILQKAEENHEAFKILKERRLFTASVHCAYYSAYQMSLYVLYQRYGISPDVISEKAKGVGSHKYVIGTLKNAMAKDSRFDSMNYRNYINTLKRYRKIADYSETMISPDDMSEINNAISSLRHLLTSKYAPQHGC